jgi:hypothetical protein
METQETQGVDETQKPERRRLLQVSIRKLTLWTVVVALYLSIVTVFQVDLIIFAVLTVWFVVVGMLRVAFGRKVAGIVSVVAGAAIFGWGACVITLMYVPSLGWIELTIRALPMGLVVGGPFGFLFFSVVECAFRFVDWADNLMRTKTDE